MVDRIVVVDVNDEPIGFKEYGALKYEDIYEVAGLWLTDTETGDILLAQRKWTKHNDPGKWSAAAAGTVEEGETYETNMVKEIEEEIGLTKLNLTLGPKQFVDDGNHRFFIQWFSTSVDKNNVHIKIQEDEVEAVKWINSEELIKDVQDNPQKYTPSTDESLRTLGLI